MDLVLHEAFTLLSFAVYAYPSYSGFFQITDCEFYIDEPPRDIFFVSDGGRCNFPKLKLVKMSVSGDRNQMELIKFLLGNSPVLQKMIITLIDVKDGKDRDVLLELVMFRRASSEAEIVVL